MLKVLPAAVQVGPEHPLYDKKSLTPGELTAYNVVDDPGNPLTKSTLFTGVIRTPPDRIIFAGNPKAQQQIISRGLAYGVCVMPPKKVKKQSKLRYIPLEGFCYYILAATNPQHAIPPEAWEYVALLKQELAEQYPTA